MKTITNEITQEVLLCDAQGRLNPEARGWSRHPRHVCNLRGRYLRKKRWDYWCIMGDRFLFSLTIANVDYAGFAAIYFLEYATRRYAEQAGVRLFSCTPVMGDHVAGDLYCRRRRIEASIRQREGGLDMHVESKAFGGKPLSAELTIARPADHETLNVVVPWDDRTFQFTSKQCCLPTSGTVVWGGESFRFEPDTSFACLDFGRGIWPYHTAWNWASFSGRSGPDTVGINMGAKWTDGTGMNENGIFLNGRMHKIHEDIRFTYDDQDFMRPWRMKTESSDTVDLTFTPFYDKAASANLVILSSRVHQMFGRYAGTLTVDGRVIAIHNVLGWAEEHVARW